MRDQHHCIISLMQRRLSFLRCTFMVESQYAWLSRFKIPSRGILQPQRHRRTTMITINSRQFCSSTSTFDNTCCSYLRGGNRYSLCDISDCCTERHGDEFVVIVYCCTCKLIHENTGGVGARRRSCAYQSYAKIPCTTVILQTVGRCLARETALPNLKCLLELVARIARYVI